MTITVPPAIVIHGADGLRAALTAFAELDRQPVVISGPGAAASAGAEWFAALVRQSGWSDRKSAGFKPELPPSSLPGLTRQSPSGLAHDPESSLIAVLDCAGFPGYALAAMRAGVRHLLLDRGVPAWPRVAAVARAEGVVLYGSAGPVFDPRFFRDPIRACRDWLAVNP